VLLWCSFVTWLRERDLNPRPLGYEEPVAPRCRACNSVILLILADDDPRYRLLKSQYCRPGT
jgi:hypothetical protein